MPQGRQAVLDLLENKADWPPVVVPFGLDPWGWHGKQKSYREVCEYALDNCTLLPKVFPLNSPLFIGAGNIHPVTHISEEHGGFIVRRIELAGAPRLLCMEEVRTPGDSSWKNRKRWIEDDRDFDCFLRMTNLEPAQPDLEAVREKERQVGDMGLPYVEVADPFATVSEMFPTDEFFIKIRTDTKRIIDLQEITGARIIKGIESLCKDSNCPFILRMIGGEMAVPPFLSRDDFIRFEGKFYRKIAGIAHRYGVPSAFHCHGPVRDIMDDIWGMGYDFIEPFEPEPRGNVTIAEALSLTNGRGVVFGGIDDVIFNTGTEADVRHAVECCLNDARDTGLPYILSQSATPFHDPLPENTKLNLLLFMELGLTG